MLLALATFVFLHTLTASALGPLPTLSFYLHDDSIYEGSSTTNDVIATLWFNFTIYQYTLPSTKKGSIQTSTSNDLTIIDEYNCDILHNNKADETKLMIENNDADGVILNKIQLMTASGTWYGLQHVCITEEEWIIWQRDFSELIDTGSVDVATCSSGKARNYFCIDNDPIECAPYKQMYYFDRLRPNEYIQDAECVDGTDIIAQFESCEPTKAPTLSPSKQATISPTLPPNTQPTISPIKAPLTLPPSKQPTAKHPTLSPIQYHSVYVSTLSTNDPLTSTYLPLITSKRDSKTSTASTTDISDRIFYFFRDNDALNLMLGAAVFFCCCCSCTAASLCVYFNLFKKWKKAENELVGVQIVPQINVELQDAKFEFKGSELPPAPQRVQLSTNVTRADSFSVGDSMGNAAGRSPEGEHFTVEGFGNDLNATGIASIAGVQNVIMQHAIDLERDETQDIGFKNRGTRVPPPVPKNTSIYPQTKPDLETMSDKY
eukprot:415599_1